MSATVTPEISTAFAITGVSGDLIAKLRVAGFVGTLWERVAESGGE